MKGNSLVQTAVGPAKASKSEKQWRLNSAHIRKF